MASFHSSTPEPQLLPRNVGLQNRVSPDESESFIDVSSCNTSSSIEMHDLEIRNDQLLNEVYSLKSKLFMMNCSLKTEKRKAESYIKESVDIKETLSKKNSEIIALTDDNCDKTIAIERLRQKCKTQTELNINLKSEIKTLKTIATQLEDKLGKLQNSTDSKSVLDQLNDRKQELNTAMAEIENLNKRVEELSIIIIDKEKEKQNDIKELKTAFVAFQTTYETDKQEEKKHRAKSEAERKKKEEKSDNFQKEAVEALKAIHANQKHNVPTISPQTSQNRPQKQGNPPNYLRASTSGQNSSQNAMQQSPWKISGIRGYKLHSINQKK